MTISGGSEQFIKPFEDIHEHAYIMHRLVARLFSAIGQQNALDELRWMRQHVGPPSVKVNSAPKFLAEPTQDGNLDVLLEQMIQRRLNGEPLQYILGSLHQPQ